MLRYHDLEIMQDNILAELSDLQSDKTLSLNYPIEETGPYIQQRYRQLWEEITREDTFTQNEMYKGQQRINEINELKANFARTGNPNMSLDAVAYHWLEHVFKPVIDQLKPLITNPNRL